VETLVEERCAGWAARVHIVRGEAARFDAMKAATVALACSGTVTTELAMCGCPMVIAYRLGPMTYPIVKLLLRTPYIALINVAVGRFVAPERLQGDCNGETLARDLAERLDDPTLRSTQIAAQNAALEIMRGGLTDPLGAAADAIIRHLTNSQSRVSSGV
jgi:lipid-A-disaccharide synthase